jgi:hypothetical protein
VHRLHHTFLKVFIMETNREQLIRHGWEEQPDGSWVKEPPADAIRKQWESQRQELLDRIMALELENENLREMLQEHD